MTVTNMDICLNVCTGSDVATIKASKKKSAFFKPQFKRQLKKKSEEKNDVEKNSNAGKNKRIKQKSLADIVAKNHAQFGAIKVNKNLDELKPIIKINKNMKKPSLPTVDLDDDKKNELKSTNKPLVSFVNPSSGLKTILAKPKKIDAPKKSLSDIFSTKLNPLSSEKTSEGFKDTQEIFVVPEKKLKISKIQSSSEKPMKFKKKDKNIETSDEKTEKISHHKSSGKISSLFGNNPDVPTIGQRLVKPVNEPVFSEIKFNDLDIHPFTISNLEQNMGIKKPTIVQQTAIPHILSKRDILIRSQTGSGKTLAYALPIVESLQKIRPKLTRDSGLRALVIVPTRELALQTYECFLKLIKPFTWIVPGYLIGGEKRKAEKARLRRGCSLLVATPGRLLDHIKHTEALKMDAVECFVLDEADRMLDMGYEKDISEIVEALKGIKSSIPDNSYDPMKLLRQNTIKQFKDDDEVVCEDEKNMIDCEDASLSEEKSQVAPREYHSGTDSDTETREEPAKRKKLKKGVVTVKKISQEKGREGLPSSTRQTILLSATLTGAVEKLAGITLTDPVMVDAAADNLRNTSGNLSEINEDLIVPQGVVQSYVVTPPKLKMVTLSAYIVGKCQTSGNHKILVFMATQDMVDFYTEIMSEILRQSEDEDDEEIDPLVDIEFCKLHGSMSQKERTEVFKAFRKAQSGVLFCTDVAARGLDMPKVDCVIQYTGPLSARDYVHRIGRTARVGTSGTAIIFLTPSEIEFIRMLESRRIRIQQEDMNDILNKLMGPLSKHNSVEATATHLQNQFENLIVANKKFYNAACKGYVSWVRFYASYPKDMRAHFNRKDLHLGHYAKSFALRDPPQRIGGVGKTLRDSNPPKLHSNRLSNQRPERKQQTNSASNSSQQLQRAGMLKRSRMLNTSEYGDGLEPIKKTKKN